MDWIKIEGEKPVYPFGHGFGDQSLYFPGNETGIRRVTALFERVVDPIVILKRSQTRDGAESGKGGK